MNTLDKVLHFASTVNVWSALHTVGFYLMTIFAFLTSRRLRLALSLIHQKRAAAAVEAPPVGLTPPAVEAARTRRPTVEIQQETAAGILDEVRALAARLPADHPGLRAVVERLAGLVERASGHVKGLQQAVSVADEVAQVLTELHAQAHEVVHGAPVVAVEETSPPPAAAAPTAP